MSLVRSIRLIRKITSKRSQPRSIRRYCNSNGGNGPDNIMTVLAIGGGTIGGLIGLSLGHRDPAGSLILGAGLGFVGAVFAPSLAVPMFWPVYGIVFLCVLSVAKN